MGRLPAPHDVRGAGRPCDQRFDDRYVGLADRRGWQRLAAVQPMYNLVKRQAEVEIFPMARAENVAVFPYGPLGGGLLSGRYGKSRRPDSITNTSTWPLVVMWGNGRKPPAEKLANLRRDGILDVRSAGHGGMSDYGIAVLTRRVIPPSTGSRPALPMATNTPPERTKSSMCVKPTKPIPPLMLGEAFGIPWLGYSFVAV